MGGYQKLRSQHALFAVDMEIVYRHFAPLLCSCTRFDGGSTQAFTLGILASRNFFEADDCIQSRKENKGVVVRNSYKGSICLSKIPHPIE